MFDANMQKQPSLGALPTMAVHCVTVKVKWLSVKLQLIFAIDLSRNGTLQRMKCLHAVDLFVRLRVRHVFVGHKIH